MGRKMPVPASGFSRSVSCEVLWNAEVCVFKKALYDIEMTIVMIFDMIFVLGCIRVGSVVGSPGKGLGEACCAGPVS